MASLTGATVVFDLDGTLVDTAPDIRAAANILMRENGLAEFDLEAVRGMIGQGPRALVERAFRAAGRRIDEESMTILERRFINIYIADIARLSRPFPGVEQALETLARAGAALAVCTNKMTGPTESLLAALGLDAHFAAVATPQTAGAAKPDPAHLRAAIEGAGGRPDRAVMVGDSSADARAARAAKVRLVLVEFGYADAPLAALEPDALISHFSQLPPVVARLLGHDAGAIGPSPAADA